VLDESIFRRRLARRIGACDAGQCTVECGAVCPAGAARRFKKQLPALRQLFRETDARQIHRLRLCRSTWIYGRGCLFDASLGAISKTLRRAMDSLHEPSIRAVGTIDARWNTSEWLLGIDVIINAPVEVNLATAFERKQNVRELKISPVLEADSSLRELFQILPSYKNLLRSEADWTDVPRKARREYYCWLAGLKPGSRIVRYGCDRHFNPLVKQTHWKPTIKKRRPWPHWLVPYQYGSHADGCECRICTARRY